MMGCDMDRTPWDRAPGGRSGALCPGKGSAWMPCTLCPDGDASGPRSGYRGSDGSGARVGECSGRPEPPNLSGGPLFSSAGGPESGLTICRGLLMVGKGYDVAGEPRSLGVRARGVVTGCGGPCPENMYGRGVLVGVLRWLTGPPYGDVCSSGRRLSAGGALAGLMRPWMPSERDEAGRELSSRWAPPCWPRTPISGACCCLLAAGTVRGEGDWTGSRGCSAVRPLHDMGAFSPAPS
jgi:hypothetical protein